MLLYISYATFVVFENIDHKKVVYKNISHFLMVYKKFDEFKIIYISIGFPPTQSYLITGRVSQSKNCSKTGLLAASNSNTLNAMPHPQPIS
jgi:hypothetical protein